MKVIYIIYFVLVSFFVSPEKDYIFGEKHYARAVYSVSSAFDIDPCIVYAVIENVDGGLSGAYGEAGIMKIKPDHIRDLGMSTGHTGVDRTLLFSTYYSIYVGSSILKKYTDSGASGDEAALFFIFGPAGKQKPETAASVRASLASCRSHFKKLRRSKDV